MLAAAFVSPQALKGYDGVVFASALRLAARADWIGGPLGYWRLHVWAPALDHDQRTAKS